MILIHSYGKVGSTSLLGALDAIFPGEVAYSHGLQPHVRHLADAVVRATGHDDTQLQALVNTGPAILARVRAVSKDGGMTTVVTGVRDPVPRSLSLVMQTLESVFTDAITSDDRQTAEALNLRLRDLWLNDDPDPDAVRALSEWGIKAPLFWLRDEVERPFGVSILAAPFDPDLGYQIMEAAGLRVLIYRIEDGPVGILRGLGHLFPDKALHIPHLNDGGMKKSGRVYEHLKAIFRLPMDRLERIYANPYVSHFYSRDEMAGSMKRWAEK